MNKLKQYFSLAIVFWGAANLSQSSLAQYWVPIQPPVPSHDIMFPRQDGINSTPSSPTGSTPSSPTGSTPSSTTRTYSGKGNCAALIQHFKSIKDIPPQHVSAVLAANGC